MKLLTKYINGNYRVLLFDDGTKIRSTLDPKEKEFHPIFPENIDVKITNKCLIGCPFCHEGSTKDGKSATREHIHAFIRSLRPGTELAIGGGGLSSMELMDLQYMLELCDSYDIYPSITINQSELEDHNFVRWLHHWIKNGDVYGVGISFQKKDEKIIDFASQHPDNVVIHTINGIHKKEDYEYLAKNHLKVLVLGYKDFRRGHEYKELLGKIIEKNQNWLKENVLEIASKCKTLSFDNLAVQQLNMKDMISEGDWERYYMGDDGTHTMFVDLVDLKFARNSTTPEEERFELTEDLLNSDISKIFYMVKKGN